MPRDKTKWKDKNINIFIHYKCGVISSNCENASEILPDRFILNLIKFIAIPTFIDQFL